MWNTSSRTTWINASNSDTEPVYLNPGQRIHIGQKLKLKIWKIKVIALELNKLEMSFCKFCPPDPFHPVCLKIIHEASSISFLSFLVLAYYSSWFLFYFFFHKTVMFCTCKVFWIFSHGTLGKFQPTTIKHWISNPMI